MIERRLAHSSDAVALKALWTAAFPEDDADDIHVFFERFFERCRVPILVEDGRVLSMLFLMPQVLRCGAHTRSAAYIYAGATQPDRRGEGLYRALLTYAEEVAIQDGAIALFLHPATERLTESYRRMGFAVPMECETVLPKVETSLSMHVLDACDYRRVRRRILDKLPMMYVDWDEETLDYALSWCRAVSFGEEACALFSQEGERVTVWEYLSYGSNALPFAATTCRAPGGSMPIGLLKPIDKTIDWKDSPLYMGYGLE